MCRRMRRRATTNGHTALCSFFVPGLGQLLQGRLIKGLFQFVLAGVLWFFLLWLGRSPLVGARRRALEAEILNATAARQLCLPGILRRALKIIHGRPRTVGAATADG